MKFFSAHISPKIILNMLLIIAVFGMILILLSVSRMNSVLSTELGFDKDSVISIKTEESRIILPDSIIFSSELPGFNSHNSILVRSEYKRDETELGHQFISDNYFDFFNYEKLNEKPGIFLDHGKAQLIYINERAVEELGIYCIDDAPGTIITDENDKELIICGVVKDYKTLTLNTKPQAKIYQLTAEHLAYAFALRNNEFRKTDKGSLVNKSGFISFQQRIQSRYKIWEDLIYSIFLFINAIVLLICLGHIGSKFTYNKEGELFKIIGTGVHIITLVISKTYIYLIAIIGLLVIPVAFLIQKLWLELYVNRINFGLIDLFIILSMAFLTVYLVCCPKHKLEEQLKGKAFQHN